MLALGRARRHRLTPVDWWRPGSGGKTVGGGSSAGSFATGTSRALDPQLHTHAVVANFAERAAGGRRVALDATALYQQAKTGGFVERDAAELERHAEEIRGHEARLAASRNEREVFGPLWRSARATLNERIARQEQVLARGSAKLRSTRRRGRRSASGR